ncbi:Lrp/AsnC family transcriptional regulator [Streptomyces sp. XD-27]|uniref:Lrp/AsnC family transcriptional regulator n=1 Tax=Streptomyces sp. XD-27 TaxID=3062779 RepID=UPI0026F46CD9|nr:Lrp/AsnC family transcriptional regulator [Streptomyces sp. XD-27]WKX71628.1 Lrp/AsnC family transcriptional regulator [Streptomyces sp. XD-27]
MKSDRGRDGKGAGGRPGPAAYDELDRQLVHALQLDGRAPFSRIAEVLGVSDQTVARRYTRLRTSGAIRVFGLTEPARLGEVVWLVRVECEPDAAASVAEALARRPDTSWVTLLSGGTEIVAVTRAAGDEDSNALLLRALPRTRQVVSVTAHLLLHTFFGGRHGLVNKSGALTERQAALLAAPDLAPGAAPAGPLTDQDRRMLEELARDGRARPAELAASTGWSQTTVRRRLAELAADGTLYFDVDYDHRVFGLGITAMLWLSVAPPELAATGEALARHPEVGFVCATTGPHNLLACVVCADVPALYTYLTTRVAALGAVRQMETSPRIRTVKGPGPLQVGPHARRPGRTPT